jgi:hypothetical protein
MFIGRMDEFEALTQAIDHLDLSGFSRRDFYFKADGKISKLSHLRIRDNYLRFYLCEFKTSKKIGQQVVQEVEEKCRRIKLPKRYSVRHK